MTAHRVRAGVARLFQLALRRPDRAATEADAELDAVLDAKAEYLIARGMSPEAARAEATRALGIPLDAARALVHRSARHREQRLRTRERLGEAVATCRYALRTLRRSPAFAVATIATLALAIGATTAIYTAVNAVILRPLPYTQPDRLVTIGEDNADFNWRLGDAAPANFLDWQDRVSAFRGVAAFSPFSENVTLTGFGNPRVLKATETSGNLFTVLGVRAAIGRTFEDAETWQHSGRPVALVSDRVWREVLGGKPVVGQTIRLDGRAVDVVGVLPGSFSIPGLEADIWHPFAWDPADRPRTWFRRAHFVRVVARLAPGVTSVGADAALQVVVRALQAEYPATNTRMGASLAPLHDYLIGSAERPLSVAFAAAAALLLIACSNVGNLLLVRAVARSREAALRRALGAGRSRLVVQALTESLMLALFGGVGGIVLGWWGTAALAALMPHTMLPVNDLTVDWSVLGFVGAVTLVCGIGFGIGPALWMARGRAADALKDEARGSSRSARSRRWGDALLVSQVALALALTLGAGLLVKSYDLLRRVKPGFDPNGVLAVKVDVTGPQFDSTAATSRFYDDLLSRARGLPGVESVGLVSTLPLTGPPWSSEFAVAGRPPFPRGGDVVHREVSPDYQRVMRVPLIHGRLFTDADRPGAPSVVLINETLAKAYFGGEDPIGLRVAFDRIPDSTSHWRTIVGVVGDERQTSMNEAPRSEFLAPAAQAGDDGLTLLLRTTGDPLALVGGVKRIVRAIDPDLAISSVKTMGDVRAAALARDRFLTGLFLLFATVGVVLGVVGIYGVVAQLARRRMRELGIRVALGARRWQVQWLVVRRGLALSAIGIAIGVGGAIAVIGVMRSLLYGVAPVDPLTFATVPALVLVTAALASWVPALRASRSDAAEVLRAE